MFSRRSFNAQIGSIIEAAKLAAKVETVKVEAAQTAHYLLDRQTHEEILRRLDKQDIDATRERAEMITALTILSTRQWKGLLAVLSLVLTVLGLLLKKELNL